MNLIGICGKSNAGKDTAADILVEDFGYVKVALADPMKRACADWFGWDEQTLWGPSEKRNEPHAHLGGLTPRHALQTLGTEWGRDCYPDVWVDIAIRTAKALCGGPRVFADTEAGLVSPVYNPQAGLYYVPSEDTYLFPITKGVCISDVRFPNEVAAIKAAGGRIWKIIRPEKSKSILRREAIMHDQPMPDLADWQRHESESYADGIEADLDIANVGSLETFQRMMRDVAGR
jgi:hypothetical protein